MWRCSPRYYPAVVAEDKQNSRALAREGLLNLYRRASSRLPHLSPPKHGARLHRQHHRWRKTPSTVDLHRGGECALQKNASCYGNAMRIIRYLDFGDHMKCAVEHPDGDITELEGDILWGVRSLDRPAEVRKILAPIAPSRILGIGLNYRRHAEETKAKIPDYPVLFGEGIERCAKPWRSVPVHLPAGEVDYECETSSSTRSTQAVSRRERGFVADNSRQRCQRGLAEKKDGGSRQIFGFALSRSDLVS